MKNCLPALSLVACLVGVNEGSAQTVFHYSVSQGAGKDLPVIRDSGPAGNDGMADPATKMNSDIPTAGVPITAGTRSIDGLGQGGVNSGGTAELLNSAIAGAGGFTMETWFFWNGGGSVNSLIDYAGTEKLVLDTAVGGGNEVRMRINSDAALDSLIGMVGPQQWHYTAAVFDTQGNQVQGGSISGVFQLYLDGQLTRTTDVLTITDFGDSLNRAIGIGKHPLNFPADIFDGLIYEPRVTLGALSADELLYVVPEPAGCWLMACGLLLLAGRMRKRWLRRETL